ncbi:MAG: hydroxymethylbilane synthase [Terriglobia bacterium]
MKLVIGSRGSRLALWQAEWVQKKLEAAGFETEIRVISTSGDKLSTDPINQSGVKGLFIKEIEEALITNCIHLAVHSMKDLPVDQPEGLCVAAIPVRDDARDVLISREGRRLADLASGSRIGTSSLRRASQLRELRPDLEIVPMRGNLDTRINKMARGDCDALTLAAAGVHRLGLGERVAEYFSPDHVCPAPGQGALAIEIRQDDVKTEMAVSPLNDFETRLAVTAERAVLRHLGGGCQTPIGAYAVVRGSTLTITGMVASAHGAKIVRSKIEGEANDPEAGGAELARQLARQAKEF